MGMEVNSQRLQQADAAMQAHAAKAPQEAGTASKERFERAMGQAAEQGSGSGMEKEPGKAAAPSPSALMESLFGSHLAAAPENPAASVQTPLAASRPSTDVDSLVNTLVERILVSEPGKGSPEIRITLGEGALAGTELSLTRAADGQLCVSLSCQDEASFQTAVGARDSLLSALERSEGNVRVDVTRGGGAEGGDEGDSRRRSRGFVEWNNEA